MKSNEKSDIPNQMDNQLQPDELRQNLRNELDQLEAQLHGLKGRMDELATRKMEQVSKIIEEFYGAIKGLKKYHEHLIEMAQGEIEYAQKMLDNVSPDANRDFWKDYLKRAQDDLTYAERYYEEWKVREEGLNTLKNEKWGNALVPIQEEEDAQKQLEAGLMGKIKRIKALIDNLNI